MKKKAVKKKSCEQKGYHNWSVIDQMGTIPREEVTLGCEDCDAEYTVYGVGE